MCILLSSIENKISLYRNCLVPLLRHRTCPHALSSCLPALSSCLLALSSVSLFFAIIPLLCHHRRPLLCHRRVPQFSSIIVFPSRLSLGGVSDSVTSACPSALSSCFVIPVLFLCHYSPALLSCSPAVWHRVPVFCHRVPITDPVRQFRSLVNSVKSVSPVSPCSVIVSVPLLCHRVPLSAPAE